MLHRSTKIAVILNPQSGCGTGKKLRPVLARELERAGLHSVHWYLTENRGDAAKRAGEAIRDGAEVPVSAGGDGTDGEVVSGCLTMDGTPLNPALKIGIVHSGTGGDFRKSLGIGKNLRGAVEAILENTTVGVDVGMLRYKSHNGAPAVKHFINIASIGISGVVCDLVHRHSLKWLGGKAAFALATLQAFKCYQNRKMVIRLDDGPEEEHLVCSLVIANGRFFGGGMRIAPDALLNDGYFDIVCLGDFKLLDFITKGRRLYKGSHLELDKVWCRKAKTVSVQSEIGTMIDIDGEAPGQGPIAATLYEKAVNVFVGSSPAVV